MKKLFKISLGFIGFGLFGAIFLHACSYSPKKAKRMLNHSLSQQYDVIIVPGVPFEDGKWSDIMKARVYWSKYLYEQGITKYVMYSGSAVYSPYVEAEIMALYAEEIGIPADRILTEPKAEHSTENIYYGHKMAKKMGLNKIALATDPFQSKLLRSFIRKNIGEHIDVIPIVFDILKDMEPDMIDPEIASETAKVDNFSPITERESFRKRWQGTMGKNINEAYYN